MKKITEELNRFNSINKYISEQFGGSLNEEESRIEKIYRNIITNVEGPGTQIGGPTGLLAWIKALKSYDDFKQLDDRIKSLKKYKDFADMINSEFESDNAAEILEVIKYLKSIGVNNGHPGSDKFYSKGTYVVKGPLTKGKENVVTPAVTDTNTVTDNNKPVVKVNPALQQTMTINKQIQQAIGTPNKTGKLSHAELEKLIGLLRPKVTTASELTPASAISPATTVTPAAAATIPQQQK